MPDNMPGLANAKVIKFGLMGPLVNEVHWEDINTKSIETNDMLNMALMMELAGTAVAATRGVLFRVDVTNQNSHNRLVVVALSGPEDDNTAVFAFADIAIAHQFATKLLEWTQE